MNSDDLYRQLQQHLDRMPIGFPATESGVEIRILRELFTPQQAEVALELSALPEPATAIHKRLKSRMTLEEVTHVLEQMSRDGLVLSIRSRGVDSYSKLIFAVGVFERQLNRLTPELARNAHAYLTGEFGQEFHSKKTTQMRVIPVNKPIPVERSVATYDDIREFVRQSDGPFAKMKCICRHAKDLMGESCHTTHLRENCLTLGEGATFMVEHGNAHFITRQEMLELLDESDQEGLVLQSENTQNPLFVCCCCGCCCGVLTSAKQLARPADAFSTNFYARVDTDDCEGCGACESRCPMDAIASDDGMPEVDRARCIGCALCVTACPSAAIWFEPRDASRVPPEDTRALYLKMFQERYGLWGLVKMVARRTLGMKA